MAVLDQITDPHNLGAILRTAWLLGVKALILSDSRTVSLTPAATKVASGGAEHVPVETVASLPQTLSDLKQKGFWIFGLAAGGQQRLWTVKIPDKVVWVIGAEGSGIRSSVAKFCDELISIPQSDKEASFNASVASALAFGETFRQRKT